MNNISQSDLYPDFEQCPVMSPSVFSDINEYRRIRDYVSVTVHAIGLKIDENGAESITPQSDEILKLVHPSHTNSETAQKAMYFNVLSAYFHKRGSGELYPTHPKIVGDLIAEVYDNSPFVSQQFIEEAYAVGLIHDAIEEGPMNNPHQTKLNVPFLDTDNENQRVAKSIRYLNSEFPRNYKAGYRALLTMEPPKDTGGKVMQEYAYVSYVRQMELANDPIVMVVALADKAANVFSQYGDINAKAKNPAKVIANFAKYKFMYETFMEKANANGYLDLIEPMANTFLDAWTTALNIQNIDRELINRQIETLYQVQEDNMPAIDTDLNSYNYQIRKAS